MRRAVLTVILAAVAAAAAAAVFERYLSPDRPEDRAILAYLEQEQAGTATSDDLAELGVLLLHKGFPKDAERYLEKALDLDKHNVEARYRLGLVLQRQEKYSKACRQYQKVVKERPGHAYARFMLALAEERAGRRDRAVYDYAKAYRHAPELADPAKNPLVLDSRLQVEAELLRYRREVEADTIDVSPIDPEVVRQMMEIVSPGPASSATQAEPQASPAPTAPPAIQISPTSPGPPGAEGRPEPADSQAVPTRMQRSSRRGGPPPVQPGAPPTSPTPAPTASPAPPPPTP